MCTILQRAALAGLLLIPGPSAAATAGADRVRISYLFNLSSLSGVVPYNDVTLHVDRDRDELYAVVGNSVRVFNDSGMEIYRFDHDPANGQIFDLVVLESDEILLLTYEMRSQMASERQEWQITRCDYRGRPIERLELIGLPEELADFGPNLMFHHSGQITLVSRSQLKVVKIDSSGSFLEGYDLTELARLDDPGSDEIFGFDLDRDGNMLFTIPTRFRAYVVSPTGDVRQWGMPGSAPGKFGIVSGIVGDDFGNILIADKLRNVVMVFAKDLSFLTEFFMAGEQMLSRPTGLAAGKNGRFYVTQTRNRGVSAFRLTPVTALVELPAPTD